LYAVRYLYIYIHTVILSYYNQGTFLFSVCYYVSYAICIKFHRKKKKKKKKGWLAEVMFVPSTTLTMAFQRSRHFRARFSPRPFLAGWVWGPNYTGRFFNPMPKYTRTQQLYSNSAILSNVGEPERAPQYRCNRCLFVYIYIYMVVSFPYISLF